MVKEFSDNVQFRNWLSQNAGSAEGIWIRIYKDKSKASITADEALDECLCFGWIDGQMKSEGRESYKKYYSPRRTNSKWSEKNKKSIERLRNCNVMTEYGEREVRKAIENGQWNKEAVKPDFVKLIADIMVLLQNDADLLKRFSDCPLSKKKQYAGFYYDAKSDDTKRKRLEKIITAIRENKNGMLY